MFGVHVPESKVLFVSNSSIENGSIESYGLKSRISAVKGCRTVSKRDMKYNDTMPKMRVDPESYTVEADGRVCSADPSETLPLTQAYYLY